MQGIKNLTHGPINRQLFNLAMPIMATSFIQMAYSLTDMAWVGRLGSEAVAAIGSVLQHLQAPLGRADQGRSEVRR